MTKSIQSVLALAAFVAAGFTLQAQPAPKILFMDMEKIFDSHYKTQEQTAKLKSDEQKAQEQLDVIVKEGTAMVTEFKDLQDKAKNPTATAEAKAKAEADAAKKLDEIRQKQSERDSFLQKTRETLQQRFQTFKSLMLDDISHIAMDVAKRKGATILIDKSGPSMIGVSNIIYYDPSLDITDEVIAEINKDRPASSPAATAAPAAAPAAGSGAPTITVPSIKN